MPYGIDYPTKRMMTVGAGQTCGLSIQMCGITNTFGLMSNSVELPRAACWHISTLPDCSWAHGVHGADWIRCRNIRQDSLRRQAGRQEHHRQAAAGMSIAAHEIQVAVATMPVVRAQVAHLQHVMAEAERGALSQVVEVVPFARRVGDFDGGMLRQIGYTNAGQATYSTSARCAMKGST